MCLRSLGYIVGVSFHWKTIFVGSLHAAYSALRHFLFSRLTSKIVNFCHTKGTSLKNGIELCQKSIGVVRCSLATSYGSALQKVISFQRGKKKTQESKTNLTFPSFKICFCRKIALVLIIQYGYFVTFCKIYLQGTNDINAKYSKSRTFFHPYT